MSNEHMKKMGVIGLGYVGLPLAIALAKHFEVIGFDINEQRIQELQHGIDRTHEIEESELRSTSLHVTSSEKELTGCEIYIVTVPTPVTPNNEPDFEPLQQASKTVGRHLGKNSIVVFESTVYPGATENICAPILEEYSGLKCGRDFYLGYSPERINPGDKHHTIHRITKVVAGQTPEIAEVLAQVYGAINNGNIFIARDIKTAEAAKVIENTQRDINIAFVNEITKIFSHMDISIYDVLDAAATKWNFLKFAPGLVGGHCIGVDPYYLAHAATELGCSPTMILSGRTTNESMSGFIAEKIHQQLQKHVSKQSATILILGLTFKENIPDLRNTKMIDLIRALTAYGHQVTVHDPCADPKEASKIYEISLTPSLEELPQFDCVVGGVAHTGYTEFNETHFKHLLKPNGLIADIKGMWRDLVFSSDVRYWSL